MNSAWREITLGDVFEISSSKRVLQRQWQAAGVPFYRAREIVKLSQHGTVKNDLFISEELFEEFKAYGVPEPDDLMVSAVGTLGACYIVQPKDHFYFKDASVLRFHPKEPVDSRFVQHAFRTHQILDQVHAGSGSTVGTFTILRAKKTRLWLPPLAEQKRIAAILDAADALRAKRRESLAQLDIMLQSTFLDMFGDPVNNAKGWPVKPLGQACDVRDGTHDSPKYVTKGHPLLTSKNFKEGTIDYAGANLICQEDFYQINKRSKVDVGDLVMPMIDTIGNPVLVEQEPDFAIKNVALIKFSSTSPNSRFLRALLCSHYFDHITAKANRGGTQKFVALKDLRSLPIPLPPVDLQRRFAVIVESVEQQNALQRAHLAELDTLFASLQSGAFRGDL